MKTYHNMKARYILITMLAVTMMTACKQRTETAGREPEPQPVAEDTASYDPLEDDVAAPAEPVKAPQSSYFERKAKSANTAATQAAKPAAKTKRATTSKSATSTSRHASPPWIRASMTSRRV